MNKTTMVIVALLCAIVAVQRGISKRAHESVALDAIAALAAEDFDPGFARALAPIAFAFPRDHGPHPDFRHEWWYVTGNLHTADQRAFGFQLTFFRISLQPSPRPSNSAWRTHQVMMAHFAVSDISNGRFHQHERSERVVGTLAGALANGRRIWLRDSSLALLEPRAHDWHLVAHAAKVQLDLELGARAPPVLHGDRGLSQKGEQRGNASYYYSLPRLDAAGTLTLAGKTHGVVGQAWLDREWSTSALERSQRGWDWFALQLDDDTELMFYQLRDQRGRSSIFSAGSLHEADGRLTPLRRDDVSIRVIRHWRSPHTSIRYPSAWRLSVPRLGLELHIAPRIADQEWHGLFRYWEGAVNVSGRRKTRALTGLGYVELTGYGSPRTPHNTPAQGQNALHR